MKLCDLSRSIALGNLPDGSQNCMALCTSEALPRGGPMSPVCILKRLVSVFINVCGLLSALLSLSQFGRGKLSLAAISFYALSLLLGHVTCRNLPWQGLTSAGADF